MRRVIRRSSSLGSSRKRYRRDYPDSDQNQYSERNEDGNRTNNSDSDKPKTAKKKRSPWFWLIIIAIIGVIIWAVTSGSSPSTNQTKQAGPEAVVKAVFNALGQNRLSTAKNYVAANDSAAKNQLETLFANYSGYFFYDDDYINFNQMNYNVASQTESAAVVSVYGQADIVEVTYEIYEDEWGEEQEDKIEEVVEQNSFSGIKFSLEKNGAEWQLSEVPTEIF